MSAAAIRRTVATSSSKATGRHAAGLCDELRRIDQRRISFGGGGYATPEWSPRGDLIAFTRIAGNFRIGVMGPDGGGERLLTNSWQDEAPSWSPNGRVIQFFRLPGVGGNRTSGRSI